MTLRTLILAMVFAVPATAAPFQDIPALEKRVTAALGAGIGEPGGPMAPIDRRLKLAACPANVTIDPPRLGAIALRCPALGWRIRVPLTRLADAPAQGVAMIAKAEPVVRRGDPVDLVAEADGFSVSISATAQEDGVPGARIRVRADGKRTPIYAEVMADGSVRLPGFK